MVEGLPAVEGKQALRARARRRNVGRVERLQGGKEKAIHSGSWEAEGGN